MYNSWFKYYTKMLLGKKNEMWYFDRWNRIYQNNNRNLINEYFHSLNDVSCNGISDSSCKQNPLYDVGSNLRSQLIDQYHLKMKNSCTKVLIHKPPIDLSPAGNSWLTNFQITLNHLGIETDIFWDQLSENQLEGVTYIVGIGAENLTKNINWSLIEQAKSKSSLKMVLQTTFDIENMAQAEKYINDYQRRGVDYFFSFDSHEFNTESKLLTLFEEKRTSLLSIEFSANPLIHFPCKYIDHLYDFTFIGSSNYDKIKRYNLFFPRIVDKYKGLIIGTGWKWSHNFDHSFIRDALIYSKTRIGINIHLETQIKHKRQLNERAYILAAFGIPQVTDHAAIIDSSFPEIGITTNTPNEFIEGIEYLLNNKSSALDYSYNALVAVYEKHNSFLRATNFINQLEKLQSR